MMIRIKVFWSFQSLSKSCKSCKQMVVKTMFKPISFATKSRRKYKRRAFKMKSSLTKTKLIALHPLHQWSFVSKNTKSFSNTFSFWRGKTTIWVDPWPYYKSCVFLFVMHNEAISEYTHILHNLIGRHIWRPRQQKKYLHYLKTKTTIELFTLLRFVQKEKLCRGRIVLQRRQFIYWQTGKKAVKWEREKWREG